MCDQDIFAGYLCLGALHAQPRDAHLHHCCFTSDQIPPVPCSQHTPWSPGNSVEMQSSTTAKFSIEGHAASRAAWGMFTLPTHLLQRSEGPQKLTCSHACLYLIGMLPPCNQIKQRPSPSLCSSFQMASRWAGGEQTLTSSPAGRPATGTAPGESPRSSATSHPDTSLPPEKPPCTGGA